MHIGNLLWNIYRQDLDVIVRWMALAVVSWTAAMAVSGRWRWGRLWMNRVVLGLSIAAILYMTVFRSSGGGRELILIPFYSFIEAQVQPEMYRSMLMNVFLFLPLGLSGPYCWDRNGVVRTLQMAFMLSAGVEMIQLVFGLGRCEIDDVVMNCLGAGIGCVGRFVTLKIEKRMRYRSDQSDL